MLSIIVHTLITKKTFAYSCAFIFSTRCKISSSPTRYSKIIIFNCRVTNFAIVLFSAYTNILFLIGQMVSFAYKYYLKIGKFKLILYFLQTLLTILIIVTIYETCLLSKKILSTSLWGHVFIFTIVLCYSDRIRIT